VVGVVVSIVVDVVVVGQTGSSLHWKPPKSAASQRQRPTGHWL
jgi:hypothetical protein